MALNEQTEMAFGEESPRLDPVSGNEVPPGALPSEVRDDIPAQLSEGEYVVPADVLQYYGIKFFEDLRSKAKADLLDLEEGGRIGGEPVEDSDEMPFPVDELETYDDGEEAPVQGFNEGGPVTEMETPYFMGGRNTVVKTYVNAEGLKMYIRFINGIAVPPVPKGYFEEVAAETVSPVSPVNVGSSEDNDDSTNDVNNFIGYDNLSADQIAKFTGQIYGTTGSFLSVIPTVGFALNKQKEQFIEAAERISKDATVTSAIREAYANALAITKLPPNQQKAASKKFADTVKGNKVATWFGPWSYKAQLDAERKSKGVNTLQGLMKEEDIQPTIDDALADDKISDDYAYDPDDTYDYRKDPAWIADNKAKEEAAAKAAEEKQRQNDADGDRDSSNQGGYDSESVQESVDYSQSGYEDAMNKGGLASRKNKKKK
jgi:hypothetical protein